MCMIVCMVLSTRSDDTWDERMRAFNDGGIGFGGIYVVWAVMRALIVRLVCSVVVLV